jgi:phosphoglycolate phosphatase-like HAD superfamily hydrolase
MKSLPMPQLLTYDVILFDFDMTLMNTKSLIDRSILEVLQSKFSNYMWDKSEIESENTGKRLKEVFHNLITAKGIKDHGVDEIEVLRTEHKIILASQNRDNTLIPNLESDLMTLKENSKKLIIVTNNDILNVRNLIPELIHYVEFVVGVGYKQNELELLSQNYDDFKKPSPAILEIALDRIMAKESKYKVVMIGDSIVDQQSAERYNELHKLKIDFIDFKPFESIK